MYLQVISICRTMPSCKTCGVNIPDSQARRYNGYCSKCRSRIWQEMLLSVQTSGKVPRMPALWFLSEDKKRTKKEEKRERNLSGRVMLIFLSSITFIIGLVFVSVPEVGFFSLLFALIMWFTSFLLFVGSLSKKRDFN